jgi:hypothetical protein
VAADPVDQLELPGRETERQEAVRHLHLLPGLSRGVHGAQVRGQDKVEVEPSVPSPVWHALYGLS